MVDWQFNVVTTMECSKQRLCWRSSLLLLCVGWNWQSLQVETMVFLSGATLGGVDEVPSVNDVLKPEAAKKSAVKARHMTSKDDDAQIQRDIKDRFPEFTHVDCFVRLIDGKCLLDHIKLKKAACKAEGKRIATAWWQATRVKWSRATSPDGEKCWGLSSSRLDGRSDDSLQLQHTCSIQRATDWVAANSSGPAKPKGFDWSFQAQLEHAPPHATSRLSLAS